jgi:threonine/homoserine/homoserine lactone efflux protein
MTLQTWLTFLLAAGIVLIIPGPTIIAVISHSLTHGRRAVAPLVLGVMLGDFTAMSLSLLGLGAILASSATLFTALKMFGAGYLIFLGVKLWRSNPPGEAASATAPAISGIALTRTLFLTTTLNPKSIAFFIAFLPQFINPRIPILPQLAVLGSTFLVLGGLNAAVYALFAGYLRERVQRPTVRRWFNRCGGTALIGAGVLTAAMRRAA